jgi:hypothetical protein
MCLTQGTVATRAMLPTVWLFQKKLKIWIFLKYNFPVLKYWHLIKNLKAQCGQYFTSQINQPADQR